MRYKRETNERKKARRILKSCYLYLPGAGVPPTLQMGSCFTKQGRGGGGWLEGTRLLMARRLNHEQECCWRCHSRCHLVLSLDIHHKVQRNTHEGGGGDGVFEDVVLCGEMAGDDACRLSASASLCSLHSSFGVQCNKTQAKKNIC